MLSVRYGLREGAIFLNYVIGFVVSWQRVAEFRAHVATHPADSLHSCWSCGAQFASAAAARAHAAAHAPPAPAHCHLCDTTFQVLDTGRDVSPNDLYRYRRSLIGITMAPEYCPVRHPLNLP